MVAKRLSGQNLRRSAHTKGTSATEGKGVLRLVAYNNVGMSLTRRSSGRIIVGTSRKWRPMSHQLAFRRLRQNRSSSKNTMGLTNSNRRMKARGSEAFAGR